MTPGHGLDSRHLGSLSSVFPTDCPQQGVLATGLHMAGVERGSSCCHVQRVTYVVVVGCRRGSWLFEVIDCRLLIVVVESEYQLLSFLL